MSVTRYHGLLQPVGITGTVETVYLALVTAPSTTSDELARLAAAPDAVVRSALEFLEAQGLVTRTPGEPARYVAAPPDIALDGMIVQRQDSLRTLRNGLTDLVEEYRSARGRTGPELVEVVTGSAAITHRFDQLQVSAKRELVTLTTPPVLDLNNNAQTPNMARGVTYRSVYDRDYLAIPGQLQIVARWVEAGEHARASSNLPVKLAIADRRVALVPVVREDEALETGAVVVHGSGLLEALVALFETYWSTGTPLRFDRTGAQLLTEPKGSPGVDDFRLLSLLVAGLPDSSIAAQLGISTRTVWRRLQALMASVGADTRVQLAYQVAKRGWLE